MATFAIAANCPLTHLDFAFVQRLSRRLPRGILAPGDRDQAAHNAYAQAVIGVLESVNPRSPAETAIASLFVTACCDSMAGAHAACASARAAGRAHA